MNEDCSLSTCCLTKTWVMAVWSKEGEHTASYKQFLPLFRHVFNHFLEGKVTGEMLSNMKQGILRAAEFAFNVWMLAAGSG